MTQEERERECARQRIQDYTDNLFRFLRQDFECQERHLKAEGAVVAGQCLPVSVAELREEHKLKNFEDDGFTIVDMVHLCVNKDLKFLQVWCFWIDIGGNSLFKWYMKFDGADEEERVADHVLGASAVGKE